MVLIYLLLSFSILGLSCNSNILKHQLTHQGRHYTNDDKCIIYDEIDTTKYSTTKYGFLNICANFSVSYNQKIVLLKQDWNIAGRYFEAYFGLWPVKSEKFNDSVCNNILIEVFDKKDINVLSIEADYKRTNQQILEYRYLKRNNFYRSYIYTSDFEHKREDFKGIISIYENERFIYRLSFASTISTFEKNVDNFKEFENNFIIK